MVIFMVKIQAKYKVWEELCMPRRGDNIRKRNDGRWEGRYKAIDEHTGSYKYKSVYGHSYSEVKNKLEIMNIFRSSKNQLQKSQSITVNEILRKWLDANKFRLKKSTVYKYEFLINKHIVPEIGGAKINDKFHLLLNSYIYNKVTSGRLNGEGGLSSTYVRTIMIIIHSALKFAMEENLCAPIQSINTKMIKPTAKKELDILNHQEQQELERNLLIDMNSTKLGIFLSLNTGLRIGEICSLLWNDIDLDNGVIYVRSTISRIKASPDSSHKTELIIDTPKTKTSTRTIPITSKLYPVLKSMKQISKYDYVVSDKDDFTSPRTYEYRFHKTLADCNMRCINYHTLRHTFATRCIEVGIDIKTLSEILGHANVGVTMNTYVHPSIKLKREQLEKLSDY